MTDLVHQHCVPCEGGTKPLPQTEEDTYVTATPGWSINRSGIHQIERELTLAHFMEAVALVQKIAQLAESEGHHPNLYLHDYKLLKIELYTHAIGGLSVNDFIMAAKINELLNS